MLKNDYSVRLVPLGGVVGVTKNCYVYELYRGDILQDILIVDMGIGFPKETSLGVDFVIPDISYLLDKKDKIRAMLFTHGHEDHISAVRFHYEALGRPPIYASRLTAALLEAKFADDNMVVKVNEIQYRKKYTFGDFGAEFVTMTHSIPDTTHIILRTPLGILYHGSDYKLDITPPYGNLPDFHAITSASEEGILALLSDCLGADREGYTASESEVGATFDELMRTTRGRFVMTTFASNISRIAQCVESAVKYNRSICFLGRSMLRNLEIVTRLGYLHIPPHLLINEKALSKIPPSKQCVILTGSQGQFGSGIYKVAMGQNKALQMQLGDRVVFSSDPIPGNEDNVDEIITKLYEREVDVVSPNNQDALHASGHGSQMDMKMLLALTRAKYLVPIGGDVKHQRSYQKLALSMRYNKNQVFMLAEGQTLRFTPRGANLDEKVNTKQIFVDAYGVGDVGEMVLRDRETLGKEGVVSVWLRTNNQSQIEEVKFSSKGFVHRAEFEWIFEQASEKLTTAFANRSVSESDHLLKKEIISFLEQYFLDTTGRRPLIILEILVAI